MRPHSSKIAAACIALAGIALSGCGDSAAYSGPELNDHEASTLDCHSGESPPALGLMTSLPLIWPLGAEFEAIARGEVDRPWQNVVISQCFTIVPLDTLSPIAAIDPALPDADPIAGLNYLAVIQPRGLSPADNVALDDWVRAGGRLLLVLDPMLTGEYAVPLGDPRRPNDTALIPPVVKRWGLSISFDESAQSGDHLHGRNLDDHSGVLAYGTISRTDASDIKCEIGALEVRATCEVGDGRVTLYADAAIFEHRDGAGADGGQNAKAIRALMQYSFR